MRFYIICLIINFVGCKKRHHMPSDETYANSDITGTEAEDTHDVETILNLKGKIRKLFVLELGLNVQSGNAICSPIAAMMPLAKLLLGARKSSRSEKELLDALGLESTMMLKRTYKKILTDLEFLRGVEISLASRMYVSDQFELLEKFTNHSITIFKSAVEVIDTDKTEKVVHAINDWVAKHTHNLITQLISKEDIDERPSLILVNAIYFRGLWPEPFHPTIDNDFYSPAGTIPVPMMRKSGTFNYCRSKDLNAQIIELPYKGGEAAMIIVLPFEEKGLPILLRTLKVTHNLLDKALMEMAAVMMDVTIPKFKIETTIDLKEYYKMMDIKNTLEPKLSGLSEIVDRNTLYISNAVQKAVIEVTEEGTVAAAASAVQVEKKHAVLEKFKAKWPFLFYIKSNREQLFAGVVMQP